LGTDVIVQPVGPIFKGQAFFLDCFVLEDGDDIFSQIVGSNLPTYAEKVPRRAKGFDYAAAESW
jgi:hypothetical protein